MSTAIPTNPQDINTVATTTDTSIVNSVCGGGTQYQILSEAPVVVSNSHPVVSRADGALWDYTSGAYVSIQNTNFGTTTCLKAGQ
jgi:hypothetical protein